MDENPSTSQDEMIQNDNDTESGDLHLIDLRNDGIPTDFTIKVDVHSFEVHRKTLSANSKYFKAMLNQNSIESQQGFSDMKEVNPDVVRECIEFIYTGNVDEVSVDIENVRDVLQAAGIMQLNEITDLCSECLKENLQTKNCVIEILNLVTKFNFTGLQDSAQKVFVENFNFDSVAEMLELSKPDFIEYLQMHHLADVVIAWDCIKHWMEYDPDNRSELLFELLSLFNWDECPPYTILKGLWNSSIFKQSQQCLDLVHEKVFMDVQGFKKNLSIETFFLLKEMSGKFRLIPKQIKEGLSTFLKTHIVKLFTKSDFKKLTEADMMALLSDPSIDDLTGEKWKWLAVETWMKHASNRRVFLPNLIKHIKFQNLQKSFQNSIFKHALIEKSLECHQILSDMITTDKPSVKTHHLTVLYNNRKIRDFNMSTKEWSLVPGVSLDPYGQAFTFNNKLCILTGRRLLYMTKNQKWIEKASLTKNVNITGHAKIVATSDCIYVIEQTKMSCYHSISDRWDENLPGPDVGLWDFFAVAYAVGCIYVYGSNQMKFFKISNKTWSNVTGWTGTYTLGTSLHDCLYFTYRTAKVIRKSSVKVEKHWFLPNAPDEIDSLFTVSDTSIAVRCGESIYIYDELCDAWTHMKLVIPNCSQSTDIISNCTYYTEESLY